MGKIVLVSLSNAMGMQLYCSQLANVLAEKNNVSIIVTKYFDETTVSKKVKIYKFFNTKRPTLDKGLLNINAYYKSIKVINKCDVFHLLNSHPANIVLLKMSKCRNSVFTLHDPIPHTNNLLGKCRSIIDKITSRYSSKIIIHSKMHLKNNLVKKYISKIVITPLASKAKSKDFLPLKNKNVFLFFGRIEDYKGLDILIASVESLLSVRNDFKVIIAGAGNFSKYESLIKHKENFEILNYVIPEYKVKDLFVDATFCMMTYKSASQSGVIPLSYYYSRPVIVTDIDSLKENVINGETGFIVEQDVSKIVKLLDSILKNHFNLSRMAFKAFEFGNNYLSMESMAEKLVKVYFR